MSFREELLELKDQYDSNLKKSLETKVQDLFEKNKDKIELAMKTAANNGYTDTRYISSNISCSVINNGRLVMTTNKLFCEFLEKKYEGIAFSMYSQDEILITWGENNG